MEVTVLDPSVALRQLVESRFGKLLSGENEMREKKVFSTKMKILKKTFFRHFKN
jgi:hypothetical protein